MTHLNLFLAVAGLILLVISFRYKQPEKKIEWGFAYGFAQNLTTGGKVIFFIGFALVLGSFYLIDW